MPLVSIVMPCYNADKYLEVSVRSVIDQTFRDWELIIVNDGSTDQSLRVAEKLALEDARVKVQTKTNGGYVSARLQGYRAIHPDSKYVIFYDADDKLHPEMLDKLSRIMENNGLVGAAYCDHRIMDENNVIDESGINMPRYIPTRFWARKEDDKVSETSFVSIFCWTKMIEPMVLMRRTAYEQTPGWDPDFGKGLGNIGEGVYLFAEMALSWKIYYVNEPLYYYRRHSTQISSVSAEKMDKQAQLVIDKWKLRMGSGFQKREKVRLAILFFNYRLSAFKRMGSLKHELRYKPLEGIKSFFYIVFDYLYSLPLALSYHKLES